MDLDDLKEKEYLIPRGAGQTPADKDEIFSPLDLSGEKSVSVRRISSS